MRYLTAGLAAVAVAVAVLTVAACGDGGGQPQTPSGTPTPASPATSGASRLAAVPPEPVGEVPEGVLLVSRYAGEEPATSYALSADGRVQTVSEAHRVLPSPDRMHVAMVWVDSATWGSRQDRPAEVRIVTAQGEELFAARAPQASNFRDASFPALLWSADGSEVAYTLPDEEHPTLSHVYIVNADGSGQRRITSSPKEYSLLAWIGERGLLIGESGAGGSRLVLAGKEERELPVPPEAFSFWAFTLSPDGRYLAFYSGSWEEMELWALDLDSGQSRLVADAGGTVRRPGAGLFVSAGLPLGLDIAGANDPLLKGPPPILWSPDSRRIVYSRSRTDENGVFSSQLRVVDIVSGQDVAVVEDQNSWLASWSPNGRYLATVAGGYVVLFKPDGSGGKTDVRAEQLVWSKDGRLIASYAGAINMVDPDSGQVREVLTADGKKVYGAQMWEPVWSPSGRYLAFPTFETTPDYNLPYGSLYVLDSQTGEATLILEKGSFRPVGWLTNPEAAG